MTGMMLLSPKAKVRVAAVAAVMAFIAVIFLWLVYPSVCLGKATCVTSLFPLQEIFVLSGVISDRRSLRLPAQSLTPGSPNPVI
jgi:hypothetical protein